MKTSYKFVALVIVSCLLSILIFNYIEKATAIDVVSDIAENSYRYEQTLNLIEDYKYTIDNPRVILNPYGISPLTALIIFETNDLTAVTVTVKGDDQYTTFKDTFVPDKRHYIPVYGLYPDRNNEVILTVGIENYVINIQTEKIEIDLPEAKIIKPSLIKDNNLFFATSNTSHYAFAYDANGAIRWYLTEHLGTSLTRLNNGHLLVSNGTLMYSPYYYTGLLEINLLGKVYFEYKVPQGFNKGVFEKPGGNFIVVTNNFKNNTVEDNIIEISRNDGNIIKTWNLYETLKPVLNTYDWFRISKLSYDSKTNSIKAIGNNISANIDYNTGEINYINADENLFDKSVSRYINKANTNINTSTILLNNENHILKQVNLNDSTTVTEKLNNLDIFEININDDLSEVKKMSLYANEVFSLGQNHRLGILPETKTNGRSSTIFKKAITDEMIKKYNLKLEKNHNRLSVTGTFNKDDQVSIILDNVFKNNKYDINVSQKPYLNNFENTLNEITITKYVNSTGLKGKYYLYIKINNKTYNLNRYIIFR